MSKVYHLGDCHFNHRNVMKYRDCVSSVEENNQILLDNILKIVTKRDTLWLHGDICFDFEAIDYIKMIASFVGNVHFIMGNHDFMKMTAIRRAAALAELQYYVSSVYGIEKHKGAWLTHAPIHESELYGKINIHGHTHTHVIENRLYVNVSADNTEMKPISTDDIRAGWRGHIWEDLYGGR